MLKRTSVQVTKILAIIPARSGSKSIRDKNLERVGQYSLLERAVIGAIQSKLFHSIVVSTDYPKYKVPIDPGIQCIPRPPELAGDDALMVDVVKHVLGAVREKYDYFVLLQPSTPFRTPTHFKSIRQLLTPRIMPDKPLDPAIRPNSIISVCKVDTKYHPDRCYSIKYGKLFPGKFTNFENKENLKNLFVRNGAFYVCNVEEFLKEKSFFLRPCVAYEMDPLYSINIDSPLDLKIAKALISPWGDLKERDLNWESNVGINI